MIVAGKILAVLVVKEVVMEVGEYVAVRTVLKNIPRRKQTMLTPTDFARMAQSKKAKAVQKITAAVESTNTKVKEIAEATKEIINGATPVTRKALDERSLDILIEIDRVKQRVEWLEEVNQTQVEIDQEKAVKRANGILGMMKERKEKEKQDQKQAIAEQAVKAATEAPARRAQPKAQVKPQVKAQTKKQEPAAVVPTVQRRTRLKFDSVPQHQ